MIWHDFLQSRQATIVQGVVQRFSQSPTLAQPTISDLTEQGLLQVTGEEAAHFLQGQLSSDIRLLNDEHSAQYSSYSNPKGRMLASLLIWRHQQHYYLQLDPALSASIEKRLKMYILRAKAAISDVSSSWGKLGLAGAGARQIITSAFAIEAPGAMQTCISGNTRIIGLAGERFECVMPIETAPEIWLKLVAAGCIEAGDAVWQLSEIRAYAPWITLATQEAFIPQMINLDLIGGLSFNKGCYPGQEIVARTQYLGKLKKRLFHATVQSPHTLSLGMDVFAEDVPGQSAGKILNFAHTVGNQYEVLVVAQISSVAHGLHLGSVDGPKLAVTTPYPFQE